MSELRASHENALGQSPYFPSTHWSMVLTAGGAGPGAEDALAQLCVKYWYPLYAYVRRRGYSAEDAEDLTQEFFARFLERKYLELADPQRGRFRSFLLTAIKRFLNDEWDRVRTAKRGGGCKFFSFNLQDAENRYRAEAANDLTPEKLYERRWATALLEQVFARLRQEYAAVGHLAQFDAYKACLWDMAQTPSYAQLAAELGVTEDSIKMAVHRLRSRYRHVLRSEIAQTITTEGDLDDEINRLFMAFE